MKTLGTLIISILFLCHFGQQVQSQTIQLKNGSIQLNQTVDAFQKSIVESDEFYNDKYYRLVQFNAIPTQENKTNLEKAGLTFVNYIAKNTYTVSFTRTANLSVLDHANISSIGSIPFQIKHSPDLFEQPYPVHAVTGNQFKLSIILMKDVNFQDAKKTLKTLELKILEENETANIIYGSISEAKLNELIAIPLVDYVSFYPAPGQPEDFKGRSLHRSNAINTNFNAGRHYDGTGVSVCVNDDGFVGPHIDFTGRTEQSTVVTNVTGDHGDMVAGIVGGAGNLDPIMEGMAKGSRIHIRAYQSTLPNVTQLHNDSAVMVFSSSYGNGCNDGYTALCQQVDAEIRLNPSLMQVFSCGNSGTSDCGYGAGSNWGNITGGHKQGKNVIAVANLLNNGDLVPSSSRGPAADGRIKPDISANGNGQYSTDPNNTYSAGSGTSAAAPGVTGVLAQLYQVYRDLNSGSNPSSALLKACILNTAEDLGNVGPDFSFGWGQIHAYRAAKMLEDNRYFTASITQGASTNQNITIPAGVKEAKIMLYWADYESTPTASSALVNDLDLTVTSGGTTYLPWVLNSAPNATTLADPATTGTDHLNNMEQVSIFNPAAGNYSINISGFGIPQGPQTYFLVYEFITEEITVSYPIGGEGFVSSESERIHWDANGVVGDFNLEYSIDNGVSWTFIAFATGDSRMFDWTVPSVVSGEVKIRVSRNGFTDESDATFSIIDTPNNIIINTICPTSITIVWDSVPGASGYEVLKLGNMYMDSIGTTTSTFFQIPVASNTDAFWYTVRAYAPNGEKGRRAIAQYYDGSGAVNCFSDNIGISVIMSPETYLQDCYSNNTIVAARILNSGFNSQTNFQVHYQLGSNPIVSETFAGTVNPNLSADYTFTTSLNFTTAGMYNLKVWTSLPADGYTANDTLTSNIEVFAGSTLTIPFTEGFETFTNCGTASDCETEVCNLISGWKNTTNGISDDIDWRVSNASTPSTDTGPTNDYNIGNSTGKYLYLETSGGCDAKVASLLSPCIDLTSIAAAEVRFRYHAYGADMGDLRVDIFDGSVWTNDIITPIAGDQGNSWIEQIIDLTPYTGQIVTLRLRGTTGSGWLSDLAIDQFMGIDLSSSPTTDFIANKSVICSNTPVEFEDLTINYPNAWNWTFTPNTVTYLNGTTSNSQNPEVSFNNNGTYSVELETTNTNGSNTMTKTAYIEVVSGAILDVLEDFENANFPPTNWTIDNSDGATTWQETTVTGIDGNTTKAAYINNYDYNSAGQKDGLLTVGIDLTAAVDPYLYFDLAYATYNGTNWDTLQIVLSDDCGLSYNFDIYNEGGSNLQTGGDPGSIWTPTSAADWRRDSISLSSFIGNTISLSFNNITGYGNSMYIDNINITNTPTTTSINQQKEDVISIFPNPTNGQFTIQATELTEVLSYSITSMDGKLIQTVLNNQDKSIVVDISKESRGIYFVNITTNDSELVYKLVKQ